MNFGLFLPYRQNCIVTNVPKGWVLMYPGIVTHFHQELPTTKGTQYKLVSFVSSYFSHSYERGGLQHYDPQKSRTLTSTQRYRRKD